MLTIHASDSIDHACDRIIEALPAMLSRAKWPRVGEGVQLLRVCAPDETFANRIAERLQPILTRISEFTNRDDDDTVDLQRCCSVKMTIGWPGTPESRSILQLAAKPLPLASPS